MKRKAGNSYVLLIYLLFSVSSLIISIFIDVSAVIIALNTIIAAGFFYLESYKEKMILTLGNVFTVYWYFYTTSFWINIKLGYNNNHQLTHLFLMTFLSVVAFLSFQLIYLPGKSYSLDVDNFKRKTYDNVIMRVSLVLLVFIGLILEVKFFSKIGFLNFIFISRPARALLIQQTGHAYFVVVLYLVMIISLVQFSKSKIYSVLFYLTFINIVAYQLLTISRSGLLGVVIPILYILLAFGKIRNKTIILLGITLFVFLSYYKVIMSNLIFGGSSTLEKFKLNGEFESWYYVGQNVISSLKNGQLNYIYGKSYLIALYNLIIPLNNTEPLSIWYVRTYLYDTYIRGGGAGFSSIAEAVMNFGYLGVPMYFMLLGYWCKKMKENKHKNITFLSMYVFTLTLVYKFFRAEFYSLTKTSWWFFIVPLLIITFISKLGIKHSNLK